MKIFSRCNSVLVKRSQSSKSSSEARAEPNCWHAIILALNSVGQRIIKQFLWLHSLVTESSFHLRIIQILSEAFEKENGWMTYICLSCAGSNLQKKAFLLLFFYCHVTRISPTIFCRNEKMGNFELTNRIFWIIFSQLLTLIHY